VAARFSGTSASCTESGVAEIVVFATDDNDEVVAYSPPVTCDGLPVTLAGLPPGVGYYLSAQGITEDGAPVYQRAAYHFTVVPDAISRYVVELR
jgi:hypothetical protein